MPRQPATMAATGARAPRDARQAWQRLVDLAQTRRRDGDREGAIAAYRDACEHPGAPAAAHFNLGNILFEAGRWQDAEAPFARALERDATLSAAALQLARCAARQGKATEAAQRFELAIRLRPDDFSTRLEAGHALRQIGQAAAAMAQYDAALRVAPERWEAHLALARVCEECGLDERGAVHYHRARPLTARIPGATRRLHWHMAQYRLERGQLPAALEAMQQAIAAPADEQAPPVEDEDARLRIDLAEILLRLGMHPEALQALDEASRATSEATLARLAECTMRHNLWQIAEAALRRAIALHPRSASAYWNLANIQVESWQMQEALASLAQAEALAPQTSARSMRASIAARLGEIDAAREIYRELAAAEVETNAMASSAAMSALYSDTLAAPAVARLHRELFARLGEGGRRIDSFPNDRNPDRPLRLGVVTADLHRQHPVDIFFQPLLARLDKTRYPTTIYFTGTSHDEQTALARRRATRWFECASWSDTLLAQRIAEDRIDILLDLAGHTARNRMRLFGKRAAPVQATFLGYPGSTGVPNMDWIIADPLVLPPEHEPLCSERVLRLPHTVFCYAPEADHPFPDFGAEIAGRPLTFGSFNNAAKLTPRSIRLWAEVLAAVPGSRLVIKAPSFRDRAAIVAFSDRFTAAGADPTRLEFRGPTDLKAMMAEYADIDIALDTLPYNGGTTTLQALWMGAPVLVRRGDAFVSRMGASFMAAAGLEEWIADSDADYVAIAQRMAANRAGLLTLKRGMRARLLGRPAWDIDRYARDFEAALRSMWHSHCGSGAG